MTADASMARNDDVNLCKSIASDGPTGSELPADRTHVGAGRAVMQQRPATEGRERGAWRLRRHWRRINKMLSVLSVQPAIAAAAAAAAAVS